MHFVTVAVSVGEDFHNNSYPEHEKTQKLKRSTSSKHVVQRALSARTGEETRKKHGLIKALAGASACGRQFAMVSRLA